MPDTLTALLLQPITAGPPPRRGTPPRAPSKSRNWSNEAPGRRQQHHLARLSRLRRVGHRLFKHLALRPPAPALPAAARTSVPPRQSYRRAERDQMLLAGPRLSVLASPPTIQWNIRDRPRAPARRSLGWSPCCRY
jgi:hypothetical protein